MFYNGFINVIAWFLVIAGGVAFVAAGVCAGYIVFISDTRTSSQVASTLHDTYYVIRHSKHALWPMLLCMALSSATAFMGYMHTDLYVTRTFRQQTEVKR